MKAKFLILGAFLGATVVGGLWLIASKSSDSETEDKFVSYDSSVVECEVQKEEATITKTKQEDILTVVSSQKRYFEEYHSENFEVVLKNTTNQTFKKVTFTFGQGEYVLYNVRPDEEFVVVALSSEETINLKVLSVDYDIVTYFENEANMSVNNTQGGKITGSVKNNGQREIYPSEIVLFFTDSQGRTVQKSIYYAGCFFEGLIIHTGDSLDWEFENTNNYTFNRKKGIVFVYSDLEFKMYDTIFFEV